MCATPDGWDNWDCCKCKTEIFFQWPLDGPFAFRTLVPAHVSPGPVATPARKGKKELLYPSCLKRVVAFCRSLLGLLQLGPLTHYKVGFPAAIKISKYRKFSKAVVHSTINMGSWDTWGEGGGTWQEAVVRRDELNLWTTSPSKQESSAHPASVPDICIYSVRSEMLGGMWRSSQGRWHLHLTHCSRSAHRTSSINFCCQGSTTTSNKDPGDFLQLPYLELPSTNIFLLHGFFELRIFFIVNETKLKSILLLIPGLL